jgi:hypothetical protein
MCATVTLAVLLVGIHQVLPGYERRFSVREQVRPQAELSDNSDMPVVCYPRRWDSVSFYLRRDDVRVYRPEDRKEMIADLRRRPSTIIFVKSDTVNTQHLRELLRDLPASLEFIPHSRHGIVTTGVIQRRPEAPAMFLARR